MKQKMNKKGVGPIALVMAGFIGIILLVFLVGGGLKTTFDITKFISNIPTFVWVIFGIIVLFRLMGGKKKWQTGKNS